MMRLIHGIGGDVNKFKIVPWKINQPKLGVLKYTKGGKYPKAECGKKVYTVREGQY